MEKFHLFVNKHESLLRYSVVVVGVSGGPDSLALLHQFLKIRKKLQLTIIAAHLDHMFRGKQSESEMIFVQQFCERHDISCETKQIHVAAYADKFNLSTQAAARTCRYDFFKEIMVKHNAGVLALGHHGDDQVETILMRLVRGSIGSALAGIPAKRKFDTGTIIRPFLSLSKDQLLDYCHVHNLNPRFDPSNEKLDYTRNRFRKRVLPFLKEENPLVHARFQYFSETTLEDEMYLQELTKEKMNTVLKRKEKQEVEIDTELFCDLPLPLQRRGIQLILNYLYENIPSSLSSIHIEGLQTLLSREHPSGSLDYPGGLKVIKSYQLCLFTFEHKQFEPYCYTLEIPSMLNLPNGYIIKSDIEKNIHEKNGNHTFIINRSFLTGPLLIRTRKPGDKIKVKGMNGTKKVKDIFIDEKVPLHSRSLWPIVEDGNGNILWIPSLKKSIFEGGEGEDDYVVLHYKKH
ncbi:tRNA lysidine(34) synthetase TilS [Metabacillus herbersteinensis]|uniref:tRNA(Ile)-lysidine synthase n=1 Tax=Metabacillus herbersteinensis TaxID=283816 RepID=A0ABV6GLJ4_9BACI